MSDPTESVPAKMSIVEQRIGEITKEITPLERENSIKALKLIQDMKPLKIFFDFIEELK